MFPESDGTTSCGIPVVGAPAEARSLEHTVAAGAYQGRPDHDLWISGVAAANVSRVEVELADGRRLHAPLYDSPPALGLELKFFLVRTRFRIRTRSQQPAHGAPTLEIPLPAFRAFRAYEARGGLLERLGPETSP